AHHPGAAVDDQHRRERAVAAGRIHIGLERARVALGVDVVAADVVAAISSMCRYRNVETANGGQCDRCKLPVDSMSNHAGHLDSTGQRPAVGGLLANPYNRFCWRGRTVGPATAAI